MPDFGKTHHRRAPMHRSAAPMPELLADAYHNHGLLHGAQVMTAKTMKPVERLRAGDRLVTRGAGLAKIRRIECRCYVAPAVYVIAGSAGHREPRRDTMLPADQPVLLRDWRAVALFGSDEIVVPAKRLTDGDYVRHIGLQVMACYRIYLASARILYADGMELGSADWADLPPQPERAINRAST